MAAVEADSAQTYSKHFIPLESNPEVFTELIHKLGVADTLCFQDVFSLDDPDLLALVPRPVYALILVFPTSPAYEDKVEKEDEGLEEYQHTGNDEEIVFFKQTINNACGLYAILHAVCNGDARKKMKSNLLIDKLLQTYTSLEAGEVALQLEGSEELEHAYTEVARKGDTEAPENPEDEVDFHYICFVKSHQSGHLYQLDGDRKRPINLGPLAANEDVLSSKCLDVIRRMFASEDDNISFSLMALVEE
ncbi:ubiquitin C-terminal hydrolase L3 [Pyrenochaeta sp. DS3sAY3a]|nr:ubiquitin C-terminal hydrolase L3 [Pyrenochaeta sp. DS3sAY3a]